MIGRPQSKVKGCQFDNSKFVLPEYDSLVRLAGSAVMFDCSFNSVNCKSAIFVEGNVDPCVFESITRNDVVASQT